MASVLGPSFIPTAPPVVKTGHTRPACAQANTFGEVTVSDEHAFPFLWWSESASSVPGSQENRGSQMVDRQRHNYILYLRQWASRTSLCTWEIPIWTRRPIEVALGRILCFLVLELGDRLCNRTRLLGSSIKSVSHGYNGCIVF